jgi:hypothetical protein
VVTTLPSPALRLVFHLTITAGTREIPTIDAELEALVVRLAQENRAWDYDRIVDALTNLGYTISDQTLGNILKRRGFLISCRTPTPHAPILVRTDSVG